MDLLDKIDRTSFIGNEFILFLWFASEVLESELPANGSDTMTLWLDDQLVLAHPVHAEEKATLKGVAPSGTAEAKEALRQGKLPERAHVGLTLGERSYTFTLEGDPLRLGGIKLPALVDEDIDEQFYERMMLLDQLEEVMGALLERFVRLRLSRSWKSTALPLMRAWVDGSPDLDAADAKKRVLRLLKN